MWTKNFHMIKLGLEKTEEPEIKLSTFVGSYRKQRNPRKASISASLTMQKHLTVCITANWKILQEMGVPDHLTCLLWNLYMGQDSIARTVHGTMDCFKIGKGVHQGCILSLYIICFFYMQGTSCELLSWMTHKLESRFPGKISTTSDMWMISL